MRIIFLLVALMVGVTTAHAQVPASDLMGLGMSGPLAEKVASIGQGSAVLNNNTFLKGRNAADSGNIDLLKVDGSDDTILNADSGDVVKIAVASTPEVQISDDKATFIGNTGVIAAPTAVALAVGAVTELTAGNDLLTFSGDGAALAAPTAVAFNVGGTSGAVSVGNLGISFSGAGLGVKLPVYVPTMAATPAAGTNDCKVGLNVVGNVTANDACLLKATPVPGDVYEVYNTDNGAVRVKAGGAATINGATAGGYVELAALSSMTCRTTGAANHNCELNVAPTPAGP